MIAMEPTYSDMYMLLQRDPVAKQYFETLPDHVREQIGSRSGVVNSLASLKDHAENLTRGER